MRRLSILLLLTASAGACTGTSDLPNPVPDRVASGRVDVGGYELAYTCEGEGDPVIVTEAGYNSAGTRAWGTMMDELSLISRVCSYDRAGTGTSDPRPGPRGLTSADQAEELHTLLQGAGFGPPYVLVAHSYGGFVTRLFGDVFPDETAGIVLVESSHEDEIDAYRRFYGDDPAGDWVDGGDLLDIEETEDALRRARDYGDVPLVAIRAERYDDVLAERLWIRTQADLATLSSDGVHIVALGSGHFVMQDNAETVAAAVQAVVASARSGDPLPACEQLVSDLEATCP